MNNPVAALRGMASRQFNVWLERRSPPKSRLELDQGRIYIFPSRVGLGFLALMVLLLIMAINYQNNLVFGFCFGLFSLLVVNIFHCFTNLSGLHLKAGPVEPVFAGDLAHFHLFVDSGRRARQHLQLGFDGQPLVTRSIDGAAAQLELRLPWPTDKRGYLRPGRVRVRSDFPLGLLRCWSLPALDWQCLVYPQPKMLRPLQSARIEGDGGVVDRRRDSDEFSGFQRYQLGEPPRRIYWKAYAKGQDLLSKHYEQSLARDMILDWDSLDGLGVEDRLSVLCAWAIECDKRNLSFALRLPGALLASGNGTAHLASVLRALALFDNQSVR